MRRFCLILTLVLGGGVAAAQDESDPFSQPELKLRPLSLPAFGDVQGYRLPEGGVFLVPPECAVRSCDLVTISHTRGRTPDELAASATFQLFLQRLLAAHLPVLLSAEGGRDGWGGPEALWQLTRDYTLAREHFHFSGRTYTVGISMGGLSALRAAVDAVFDVHGLIVIDGRVNLFDAWQSDQGRQNELSTAYALDHRPPVTHEDPLRSLPPGFKVPLLVFGSLQDRTVNFSRNGEALYRKAAGSGSTLVRTSGPHLGGSHLDTAVAQQVVAFIQRVSAGR